MSKYRLKKLKRKFLKFSGTVIIATLLSLGTVKNLNAQFSGGSGTATDPWQIYNLEQLLYVDSTHRYNGRHFILMADITDTLRRSIRSTVASFDGNGYSIVLGLENTGTNGSALFQTTINGTIIKNVTVTGYINGEGSPSAGIVSNSTAGNNPWGDTTYIINCINNSNISGFNRIGGIVSVNSTGTLVIEGCLNLGTLTQSLSSTGFSMGGIIGSGSFSDESYTIVRMSKNSGFINGLDGIIGGILGGNIASNSNAPHNHKLENNINTNVVKGTGNNIGCIVGNNGSGILINNHYDKQMCGDED